MFQIEFETVNEAVTGDNLGPAIADILRKLADYIEPVNGAQAVDPDFPLEDGGVIKDLNGNSIGNWTLTHRELS